MADIMTLEEFSNKLSEIIFRFTWMAKYRNQKTEKEYDDCLISTKSAYTAALARIEALEAECRWIPVGERLPENGISVPVLQWSKLTRKWMGYTAYYAASTWYELGSDSICHPEYWMQPPPDPVHAPEK